MENDGSISAAGILLETRVKARRPWSRPGGAGLEEPGGSSVLVLGEAAHDVLPVRGHVRALHEALGVVPAVEVLADRSALNSVPS
jgi:hypothetical protein